MKTHRLAGIFAFMLAITTCLAHVGAIRAEASKDTSGTTKGGGLWHCISGQDRSFQCFDTEAEALSIASGGRIQLAPGETSGSLSDSELFDPNSTIRSILYEHADYGGATLTIYGDTCSGWNNMSSTWNDKVSSARTYSCGITLYEHYNLTGSSLNITSPGTSYVGSAMNDKTSSYSVP